MKFRYKKVEDKYSNWFTLDKEYLGEHVVNIPHLIGYILIYQADDGYPAYVPSDILECISNT